jgi:hypothetical protein
MNAVPCGASTSSLSAVAASTRRDRALVSCREVCVDAVMVQKVSLQIASESGLELDDLER